jgi:hypothetical protein
MDPNNDSEACFTAVKNVRIDPTWLSLDYHMWSLCKLMPSTVRHVIQIDFIFFGVVSDGFRYILHRNPLMTAAAVPMHLHRTQEWTILCSR